MDEQQTKVDALCLLVENQTVAEFEAARDWMLTLPMLCRAMRYDEFANSTLKRLRWWLYVCKHRLHTLDLVAGFENYRRVNPAAVRHRILPRVSYMDEFLYRVVNNPGEPDTLKFQTTPTHAAALVTMYNECMPERLRLLAHARVAERPWPECLVDGNSKFFVLCVRPDVLA